jgi:hypothetical protein
VAALRKSIP